MNLIIDRSRVNRVIIVYEGKLDHSTVLKFEEAIVPLLKENQVLIVLDLARVNHITDTGVKCLQKIFQISKEIHEDNNSDGLLRIINMSNELRDLLRLKGLLLSMTHPLSSQKTLAHSTYEDKLNEIRQFFPSPTSDHLQTVHLSQLINRKAILINLKPLFLFMEKENP